MTPVTTEIKTILAEAAALEREPIRPGEDVIEDRAERRCRILPTYDAAQFHVLARIDRATQWRQRTTEETS